MGQKGANHLIRAKTVRSPSFLFQCPSSNVITIPFLFFFSSSSRMYYISPISSNNNLARFPTASQPMQ